MQQVPRWRSRRPIRQLGTAIKRRCFIARLF
jgi:hypothetical protein